MDRLVTCWLLLASIGGIVAPRQSEADDRPVMNQAEAKPAEPAAPPNPPVAQAADPRIPVPSAEARRTSTARVKEIYAEDYAAAGPPAKKAEFAKRLVEQAAATADHADRWALLTEALRLATDAGDTTTALPLIDRIPTEFAIERNGSRLEALTRLATKAAGPAVEEVASASLDVARDADKAGDEDVAAKAVTLASGIARKTKNAGLLADATRLQQKTKERQRVAKELEPLLEKVQASPADPDVNLEAGRALCLKADRWTEGLPLLAKGSDAGLARVATLEAADPKTPADLIRLADGWWDWGDGQKPPWKLPAQTHAAVLYGRVVNELQGLDKARVEKRIASVAAAGGGTGQMMFLADLQETEVRDVLDEHAFARDGKLYGKPFAVKGKQYAKAIMSLPRANSTAVVVYKLPAGAVRLRGHVGIFTPVYAKRDDQPASPLTFEIVADGKVVWTSPGLKKRDDTALFDVAIRNASKLELRTAAAGHNTNAWAAWLDPLIVK
jgi:hypothetical protein